MKKLITIITATCLMLLNVNCKETKEVIKTASNITLGGNYNVASINDVINTSKSITLEFNALEKIVSGNAGCNQFSGDYSVDALALNIGLLRATEAYCEDSVMKTERAYMNALKNTGSYSIEDGILTLYSKTDRSPLLTAKKVK